MDELRIGIIGLGRGRTYAALCRAVGGAAVTAIYDVDAARADAAAGEVGARAYPDLEAFLGAAIDAVVVASPVAFHAEQAAAALRAEKHVLSEVTACADLPQARALVRAARGSGAIYMLAENYRYLDEVELVRRLHADGRFGDAYYAEGEYLHDCRLLFRDADGALTWRGRGELGVYCTHSLGPLLYILGDRVRSVSALEAGRDRFAPDFEGPAMHLMQLETDGGRVLRVRVDAVSPRPHQAMYYALQGTRGAYESWRGRGDESKLWLEDEHEPSRVDRSPPWAALAAYAPRSIPDRLATPPEAGSGGHGASEYWMLREFLTACRGEAPSPIDVDRGLDYTLPGVLALESAAAGGAPIAVPDTREW